MNRKFDSTKIATLARKHLHNNTSARACMADGIAAYDRGDINTAVRFYLRSLAHSVGILHPDYEKAFNASGVGGEVRLVSIACKLITPMNEQKESHSPLPTAREFASYEIERAISERKIKALKARVAALEKASENLLDSIERNTLCGQIVVGTSNPEWCQLACRRDTLKSLLSTPTEDKR